MGPLARQYYGAQGETGKGRGEDDRGDVEGVDEVDFVAANVVGQAQTFARGAGGFEAGDGDVEDGDATGADFIGSEAGVVHRGDVDLKPRGIKGLGDDGDLALGATFTEGAVDQEDAVGLGHNGTTVYY